MNTAGPPVPASSPVRDLLALTRRPEVISFAGGLPAPHLIDVPGLRAAFAAVLAGDGGEGRLQYSTSEGDPDLRRELAAVEALRGIECEPDELLVTTGSQQALGLVAHALLTPGAPVLVEEPSYLAALQVLRLHEAEPVGVDCDDGGIDPDALDRAAAASGAKVVYLIPNFQNPTGRTIDAGRRAAVAEIVRRRGLWLIEDDPYGQLRFRGAPQAPLVTLPGMRERTIAISSLSKIVAPGLRIGWLLAPEELRARLVVIKQATDLHTSTVDQAAAAHWLGHADLDAHLARLRAAYAERHDALLAGLPDALPLGATYNDPDGGMFCWVRLPDGSDAGALLQRALDRNVAYVPGAAFFAGPPDPATLRLAYSAETPARIAVGLDRLADAFSGAP
ncbi:MAG: PLP-dependent aminotransferase family protein [Actinobacteria bacterium]|nr:PLP-dependent aminotransferase family protein [Actinomycetota bacterium]